MQAPPRRTWRALASWGATVLAGAGVITLAAWPGNSDALVEKRIALVVGNGAYAFAPLKNPTHDSEAVAELLRQMGFDVVELEDGNRLQLNAAIEAVRTRIEETPATVVLYYAGHGIQVDWHNYIIPVDAKIATAADAPHEAVGVPEIMDRLARAGSRSLIVILDACRDNPFHDGVSGKGLAEMDAPPLSFLAYATAPGNVAADGDGEHGLYTDALLREAARPGTKIEDVLKRVRLEVRVRSHGRQVPWESTSLESDFYFIPPKDAAAAAPPTLDQELADWDRIKESTSASDFVDYLRRYPSGYYAEAAQFRLDHLAAPEVRPQPAPMRVAAASAAESAESAKPVIVNALPSGVDRYHLNDLFDWRITDGYTGNVRHTHQRVTAVGDNRVEFNHGFIVTDQMGNIFKNDLGRNEPMLLTDPADMAPGKRWHTAFRHFARDGTVEENYYDFEVKGLERVTVPAGEFLTYRVEGSGFSRGADRNNPLHLVRWIDPVTGFAVKAVREHGPRGRQDIDIRELERFTPGPR